MFPKYREKRLQKREKRLSYAEKLYEKEKDIRERENRIRNNKKLSTTKLIVLFIFVNCTVIEAYSMWIMYRLADSDALDTLISTVVGEGITFAIYAFKAAKENSVGGITYDSAIKDNSNEPK